MATSGTGAAPGRPPGYHAPVPKLVLLLLVATCGCRLSFDKHTHRGGFPPRQNVEVSAVVWSTDEELGRTVLAAARANPTVARVAVLDEAAIQAAAGCTGGGCPDRPQARCDQAAAQGADYLLVPSARVDYDQDFVCTRPPGLLDLLDNPKGGECKGGRYENQRTAVSFELEVHDVGLCRRVQGITWHELVDGEEEVSRPEAEALLAREVPRRVGAFPFPWQAQVEAPGPAARARVAAAPDPPRTGDVLATFRGRDYLGLSRVSGSSDRTIEVRPLTCCFRHQAGDVLQQRGPYRLVDLGVGASATALQLGGDSSVLAGVAWHLHSYPIVGGWLFGLSGDVVGRDRTRAYLTTAEAGHVWKTVPGLDLSVLVGAGIAVAEHTAGPTDPSVAAHATAAVGLTFNPMPWWYVQLRAGYVHSASFGDLDGTGADAAVRGPLGRLGVGIEFH